MSSIRKNSIIRLACMVFAAAAPIGCQKPDYYGHQAELNPTPIQDDEAMQLRQWTTVTASYPNGDVPAGPTNITVEPRRGMEDWKYYYADTGAFLLDLIAMPYALFKDPPCKTVTYPGEQLEPTYTAVPPTPPELTYQTPVLIEPATDAAAEPSTSPTTAPTTQPDN